MSRAQFLRNTSNPPPVPPVTRAYVCDWFMMVGPAVSGFAGPVGISWETIDAWARRTGYDPTPWEFEALYQMSQAYAEWAKKSEEMSQRAPWEESEDWFFRSTCVV